MANALGDSDNSVRASAAQSLRLLDLNDQHIIDILTSWLTEDSHSDEELLQAIQTLGAFPKQSSGATAGLIQVVAAPRDLSPYNPQLRASAAKALAAIGDPTAIPYLLSAFVSAANEAWVRRAMAIALAGFGKGAICSVPYMVPVLDSPEPDVSIGAAVIISQATESDFPNSAKANWDPKSLGPWRFDRNEKSEFLIVAAAKKWWQESGQSQHWPACPPGPVGGSQTP